MDNRMRDSALAYARHFGWPVFPLEPQGKKPLTKCGCLDATTDLAKIQAWWERWPRANIGIACGPSKLVVIDLDKDKDGLETWEDLCREHSIDDDTLVSLTGGGGQHLLFYNPNGADIRNSAGKLGPGVDVRANGGYIVAPPSIHPNGRVYAWEVNAHPGDRKPAFLPAPLLDLLHVDGNKPKAARSLPDKIPEGERNDTLFRLACSARRNGATESEILAYIAAVNAERCEPPCEQRELEAIARSAAKYEPSTDALTALACAFQNTTDMGNATRLVIRHGQDLQYCHPWKKWLVWDGQRWRVDDTGEVYRRAKDTVRHIYAEAGDFADKEERERLAKWAMRSESKERIKAMVELTQSELGIPVRPEDLDCDPWLLNVLNGTLDLKTGQLREHDRGDFITKMTPVIFDAEAQAPIWLAFLNRIMAGNESLIAFLQRAIGYSLTGDTSERCMFVLHGCGANGKSTLLETIRTMLGDYALRTPTETLMVKRNNGIPNDIARLRGARFVSASESEQGRRLAEALIKDLTGQDTVTARFLHAEFFDFKPEFKIWLATNHKPVIRGTDKAIWDRIKLIPFKVTIPESEQDKQLTEKLKEGLPGILAWAVRGCLAWRENGLGIPEEVKAATETYRNEMDIVGNFIEDCCVLKSTAKTTVKDMYEVYETWCEANGEYPLGKRKFGNRLRERGLVSKPSTGNVHTWYGIGLLTSREQGES